MAKATHQYAKVAMATQEFVSPQHPRTSATLDTPEDRCAWVDYVEYVGVSVPHRYCEERVSTLVELVFPVGIEPMTFIR